VGVGIYDSGAFIYSHFLFVHFSVLVQIAVKYISVSENALLVI